MDGVSRSFVCEAVASSDPADPVVSGVFWEILKADWSRLKTSGPGRFIPNLGAAANYFSSLIESRGPSFRPCSRKMSSRGRRVNAPGAEMTGKVGMAYIVSRE